MEYLKIYEVTYIHGGWVTNGYPNTTVVAFSKEDAIEKDLSENSHWDKRNTHASEFKIKGYVIEVYDEKTYNRDKNLENLI